MDISTLRKGIFFVALDNLSSDEVGLQQREETIPLNQVVYDSTTNTVYAKPDAAFDQHRRYMIVVSDAVHDASGNPVVADPAFLACAQLGSPSDYCASLAQGIALVSGHVVSASIFTTLSATAWLQSVRAQLQNTPIVIHCPSAPYVFNVASLSTLTANFRYRLGAAAKHHIAGRSIRGAVQQCGTYCLRIVSIAANSQRAADHRSRTRGADVTLPMATTEIAFHAYLPEDPAPPKGYRW